MILSSINYSALDLKEKIDTKIDINNTNFWCYLPVNSNLKIAIIMAN